MTGSRWRKRAREVIYGVVEEVGTDDLDLLEKKIRAAYPFGERKYWPYKVWLSEVRYQMARIRRSQPIEEANLSGLPLFEDR